MSAQLPIRVPVIPECEIIPEGDNDTSKIFASCRKNPGHPNLFSIEDFERHLPESLRTKEFVDSIHHMIDRAVKICVTYTSKERPLVYPGTNKPYPYGKMRGKSRIGRCGSGFLLSDNVLFEIIGEPCPCHICRESSQPEMRYWATEVFTAAHVIFDDSEASKSVFECFYHSNDKSNVERFYGTKVTMDVDTDSARVVCVTHDEGLLAKLNLLDKVIKRMRKTEVDKGIMEAVGSDMKAGNDNDSDADNGGNPDNGKGIDEVKLTDSEGKTDDDKGSDEFKHGHSGEKTVNDNEKDNDIKSDEVKHAYENKQTDSTSNNNSQNTTDNDKIINAGACSELFKKMKWGAQKLDEFKITMKAIASLAPVGQQIFNEDTTRQLFQLMDNFTSGTGELTGKNRYEESDKFTAVIVSHPHGCSKKVSIGKVLGFQIVIDEKITPNTPHLFVGDTICHLPPCSKDPTEQFQPICLGPELTLNPGQSSVLPKDLEYVIPLESEYLYQIMWAVPKALSSPAAKSVLEDVYSAAAASGIHYSRRFDIFRLFPKGTQFFLHGKEIIFPPEAEFYCDQRFDENFSTGEKKSFMIYDTCTCPGSSGALLNVRCAGIHLPLLCHTHQGALSSGVNISNIETGNSWGQLN